MLDYFSLLKERRRPWLDPESLRQRFLELSAAEHPDRVHEAGEADRRAAQERYTQLNAAYNCLKNERERLAHLLELERGVKPEQLQRITPDLMDLMLEISQLCREADALVGEKKATTSALLQVPLFERSQVLTERLQVVLGRINAWREELVSELKNLDHQWGESTGAPAPEHAARLEQLERLYRLFSYTGRWAGQLWERIVELSF